MTYVLVETLASERQGRTLWFKQMTAVGPMTTPDPAERAEFATEDAAKWCPAMFHALSFYEVREVPDDDVERDGVAGKEIEDGQTLDEQTASAYKRATAKGET
jgi:hypothetical protein